MGRLDWTLPKSGSELGGWVLRETIGEGGNSFVWRAERDGVEAAVKVLKRPRGTERYERFAQEVRVHLEVLGHVQGVLPLLEADVPTGDHIVVAPWLAMPLAEKLSDRLGPTPKIPDVVAAVADIAQTLATLHDLHGVSHRDLKPENLYWYEDRPAVGDFGLVEVPDGPDLSRSDRDLGPRDLLAPEMRSGSPDRQGPPADVFSLGLTLFLLAAGFAPRDGLRPDEPSLSLAVVREDGSLQELDSVLRRATSYRPEVRPTMQEVATDLRAWLEPPRPLGSVPDIASFRHRVDALSPRPQSDRAGWDARLNTLQDLIFTRSKPTFDMLNQLGLESLQYGVRLFERWDPDGLGLRTGSSLTFQAPGADGATWFAAGVGYGEADGVAHVSLGWTVAPFDDLPQVVWSAVERVDIASLTGLRGVEAIVDEWASMAAEAIDRGLLEAERYASADIQRVAASDDEVPPELAAMSLSVRRLRQDRRVELLAFARLHDAAGVAGTGYTSSHSQVQFVGPSGEAAVAMLSADGDRVSGTRFDGWYEGVARLEAVHPPGVWRVEHVLVADQAGRYRHLAANAIQGLGFPTQVTV